MAGFTPSNHSFEKLKLWLSQDMYPIDGLDDATHVATYVSTIPRYLLPIASRLPVRLCCCSRVVFPLVSFIRRARVVSVFPGLFILLNKNVTIMFRICFCIYINEYISCHHYC